MNYDADGHSLLTKTNNFFVSPRGVAAVAARIQLVTVNELYNCSSSAAYSTSTATHTSVASDYLDHNDRLSRY